MFELRARQLQLQMLRTRLIGRDERQVDVGFHRGRQLDFCFLCSFLQPLQRHAVFAQVDAVGFLEFGRQPLDDAVVEIVAAQVRVAVGGFHFDDAVADFEHGDVECAAAEVVHRNRLVLLLVEPVCERRRSRLVDDAQDVEAGDLPGVFRRLALCVVEICRDGDDCVRHRLAEVGLSRLLQLLQHDCRDFRRRMLFGPRFDPRVAVGRADDGVRHARTFARDFLVLPAHEALDREHRVFRVGDGLTLRDLADQTFAVFREPDHRRRNA